MGFFASPTRVLALVVCVLGAAAEEAAAATLGGGVPGNDHWMTYTSPVPYGKESVVVDGGPLDADGESDGRCTVEVSLGFDQFATSGAAPAAGLLPETFQLKVKGATLSLDPDPVGLETLGPTAQSEGIVVIEDGGLATIWTRLRGWTAARGRSKTVPDSDVVTIRCTTTSIADDPDRDGLAGSGDLCPSVFDPAQGVLASGAGGAACDTQEEIGPLGGTLSMAPRGRTLSGAELVIPPGVLDSSVRVTLGEPTILSTEDIGLPILGAITVGPEGVTFGGEGATLRIPAAAVARARGRAGGSASAPIGLGDLTLLRLDPASGTWVGAPNAQLLFPPGSLFGTQNIFGAGTHAVSTPAFIIPPPPKSDLDSGVEPNSKYLPLLLVHGWTHGGFLAAVPGSEESFLCGATNGGAATWGDTKALLKVKGVDVWEFRYDTKHKIEILAGLLGQAIEKIKQVRGVPSVNILAHSMGGLVARSYLQSHSAGTCQPSIHKLMTLGTPHTGAAIADGLVGGTAAWVSECDSFQQMRTPDPGSSDSRRHFLSDLNGAENAYCALGGSPYDQVLVAGNACEEIDTSDRCDGWILTGRGDGVVDVASASPAAAATASRAKLLEVVALHTQKQSDFEHFQSWWALKLWGLAFLSNSHPALELVTHFATTRSLRPSGAPSACFEVCPSAGGAGLSCRTSDESRPRFQLPAGVRGLQFSLDGRCSSDPDRETLSYEWRVDGGAAATDEVSREVAHTTEALPAGLHTVRLKVTDTAGTESLAEMAIEIVAAAAPRALFTMAAAGQTKSAPQTLHASASTAGGTVAVTFDGRASTGVLSAASAFRWRIGTASRTGDVITAPLAVGNHPVSLTVSGAGGTSHSVEAVVSIGEFGGDRDADLIADAADNCPQLSNPLQRDSDGDRVGDGCDSCPGTANATQSDSDRDQVGDVCDGCPTKPDPTQVDSDRDGRGDSCDNCPSAANPFQADSDGNGRGDVCNTALPPYQNDEDQDGTPDDVDNCVSRANEAQADADADGFGDACDNCPALHTLSDADADGDGLGDACDNCPGGTSTCSGGGNWFASGQTTCWNTQGQVIACAGTGQDGEFQDGAPLDYRDNDNGTITDLNTGLMWEKLSDDGSIHDKDNYYTWTAAVSSKIAALNSANYAGHNDWRLPNVRELESIVNHGTRLPAVSPDFNTCWEGCSALTCSCTVSSNYWSSSTYATNPAYAWDVYFTDGGTYADSKTNYHYVRAVRGGS